MDGLVAARSSETQAPAIFSSQFPPHGPGWLLQLQPSRPHFSQQHLVTSSYKGGWEIGVQAAQCLFLRQV